ncbi:MAG: hypothetical protein GX958_08210 [Desulfitobacterium sp.]|nr:hypothetical protein [Desulfitobacterium sp.]
MPRTIIAVFKGPQQVKEAVEEIQGESLANSKISLIVRTDYLHQDSYSEEFANELTIGSTEIDFEHLNGWLIHSPPTYIPNLGECIIAGPLADELLHGRKSQGLADALITYGLSPERARHYEHKVRRGHHLVLVTVSQEKVNSVANTLQGFGGRDIEKWSKDLDHPLHIHG